MTDRRRERTSNDTRAKRHSDANPLGGTVIPVRITWSPRGDAARSGLPWKPFSWMAYKDEFCTELLATGRDSYEYADACADIALLFGDRAKIIEPTSVPVVAR